MRDFVYKIWSLGLALFLAGTLQAQDLWIGDEYDCCDTHACCQNSGWFSLDRLGVRAEGLFWKATEDNLAYAQRENVIEFVDFDTFDAAGFETIKREELNFKWKPGFRLTLDYIFPCDYWNTNFIWTNYNGHSANARNAPSSFIPTPTEDDPVASGEILVGTFLPTQALATAFNHIDAHWNVLFDNFEWNIGRYICLSHRFGLRPYIGARWEYIKQKYKLHYVSFETPDVPTAPFGGIRQKFRSCFSGIGLQGGLDAHWFMGCGFSLFSNVGGGIAYGRSKIHETLNQQINFLIGDSEATEFVTIKYRDTVRVCRPNLDFAIGLRWEHCWCNYLFDLQVAWEYHHYFDQNFFRLVHENDSGRGDLTFQGVTFGGGISF